MAKHIITLNQAKSLVLDILKARLTPNLIGPPGVGKSDLLKQIAEDNNLELIDMRLSQMDSTDLNGFPRISSDGIADYAPMKIFPLDDTPLPKGRDGWLMFLDEVNAAPPAIQAAAYKLVLDRQVGSRDLHERVLIATAGNRMEDKAITSRLSTAMQSRLVHFEISVDPDSWGTWADLNEVDHRVKSFIKFKPAALHKFDPNHQEHTFPCPRTWDFVSRILKVWGTSAQVNNDKLPALSGTIGDGMAREFLAYLKVYTSLPDIGQIMSDPTGVTLSEDVSVHYALSGLIGHHMDEKNADQLMRFLKRLNIDFQVIALRAVIARDTAMRRNSAIKGWIRHNSKALAGLSS